MEKKEMIGMKAMDNRFIMKVILTIIVVSINMLIVSNILLGSFGVIEDFYLWSDVLYGINYFTTFYTMVMFIVLFIVRKKILDKKLMIINITSFFLLVVSLIIFFYNYAETMSSF
jgi:hypothetical protein